MFRVTGTEQVLVPDMFWFRPRWWWWTSQYYKKENSAKITLLSVLKSSDVQLSMVCCTFEHLDQGRWVCVCVRVCVCVFVCEKDVFIFWLSANSFLKWQTLNVDYTSCNCAVSVFCCVSRKSSEPQVSFKAAEVELQTFKTKHLMQVQLERLKEAEKYQNDAEL